MALTTLDPALITGGGGSGGGGLSGTNFVLAQATGTPEENGTALVAAYAEAVTKRLTVPGLGNMCYCGLNTDGSGRFYYFPVNPQWGTTMRTHLGLPSDLEQYGIEAIALKDVPAGKPFKIVDITDFPLELDENGDPVLDEYGVVKQDRTFRNAWEVDEEMLTDGVGAESNEYPEVV